MSSEGVLRIRYRAAFAGQRDMQNPIADADIIDQLRMAGEQKGPLLFLDRHLGKR